MKRTVLLVAIGTFIIFYSCNQKENRYEVPQRITVAGKIDNYDPNRELTLSINWIGFTQEQILTKTDSVGNFIATFESYIPIDAWVGYRTNFQILLHPGDSLFVHLDGKQNNRPALLAAIDFGGNAAKKNLNAAKFQQMYFSNEIYYDLDTKRKAEKEYDTYQYLQYLDTIQQKFKEIYNQFVSENRPDEESKKWAQLYIENDYHRSISWYATNRKQANQANMDWDNTWNVPVGFYDRLCNRLPIDASMVINSSGLSSFHNTFFRYVNDKLKEKYGDVWRVPTTDRDVAVAIFDSIRFFSFIEFVPDPLLLQLMLTEFFDQRFRRQDVAVYERFREVADTYIKEPFLKEPLIQKYLQTKHRIENPHIYTENILKEAAELSLKKPVNLSLHEVVNLSIKEIMDKIFQQNKGKIIYIDFWGTWCGPCLAEMPNSKVVEHEFEGKDVVFFYICLESEEEQWKATIDKFKLGGHHYHLSRRQSAEIRNLVSISSIPLYVLIDKNGVIKESGGHLRPFDARDKIKEMLK